MVSRNRQKIRGEHCLNIFVSFELKEQLRELAEKHDRTLADIVRAILKIGIPVMRGMTEAEEKMIREYVRLFRKFRQAKQLKEI